MHKRGKNMKKNFLLLTILTVCLTSCNSLTDSTSPRSTPILPKTTLTIENRTSFRIAFVQWPTPNGYYFGNSKWKVWINSKWLDVYGLTVGDSETVEVIPDSGYVYFYFDPAKTNFVLYRTVDKVTVNRNERIKYTFYNDTLATERNVGRMIYKEYIPVVKVKPSIETEIDNYKNMKEVEK